LMHDLSLEQPIQYDYANNKSYEYGEHFTFFRHVQELVT